MPTNFLKVWQFLCRRILTVKDRWSWEMPQMLDWFMDLLTLSPGYTWRVTINRHERAIHDLIRCDFQSSLLLIWQTNTRTRQMTEPIKSLQISQQSIIIFSAKAATVTSFKKRLKAFQYIIIFTEQSLVLLSKRSLAVLTPVMIRKIDECSFIYLKYITAGLHHCAWSLKASTSYQAGFFVAVMQAMA